ncbi:MAG: HD domain-containing protein [Peptostreptococcaceae bacterium]|nr:HD domain-containing protein [Peptostreptococcaceae bacterium]
MSIGGERGMGMEYPAYVGEVFSRLQKNGHQAYLVGGCVRDHLMDRAVSDLDITTDALPSEVQRIFADHPQHAAGLKHGTITVFFDKEGVEITTFRQDGEYKDARRPERVFFSKTLQEDLQRRDFTINALAFSPRDGLVDLFGGRSDMQDKIIRAIGDPRERFSEDGLRILRAVRFASQLGFVIEERTYAAMLEMLPILEKISAERKAVELVKTLMGRSAASVLMAYPEIFATIVPEVLMMKGFDQNNPHHIYDVLEHTAWVIHHTPFSKDLRLAAFFHDMGKVHTYTEADGIGHFYGHVKVSEEIAAKTMHALKMDRRTMKEVRMLVRYHDAQILCTKRSVKRWLDRMGEESFFKLLDLKRADSLAQAPEYYGRLEDIKEVRAIAEEIIAEQECFQLKDLAVDGRDMMELGLCGRSIGEALALALEAVIEEKVSNDRRELIRYIKMNYPAER